VPDRPKTPTTQDQLFISQHEAAVMTGTCTKTIRRGVANGTIPARKLGSRILIDRQGLLDALVPVRPDNDAPAPVPTVKTTSAKGKPANGKRATKTSRAKAHRGEFAATGHRAVA